MTGASDDQMTWERCRDAGMTATEAAEAMGRTISAACHYARRHGFSFAPGMERSMSAEARKMMSAAATGRRHSIATVEKIRASAADRARTAWKARRVPGGRRMTGAQAVRVDRRAMFDLAEGLRVEVLQAEGAVQLVLVQRGASGERVVKGNAFADADTADDLRDLADEVARGLRLKASAVVAVPVAQWAARVVFSGPGSSARLCFTIPGVNGLPLLLAEARIGADAPDHMRAVARYLEGLGC